MQEAKELALAELPPSLDPKKDERLKLATLQGQADHSVRPALTLPRGAANGSDMSGGVSIDSGMISPRSVAPDLTHTA